MCATFQHGAFIEHALCGFLGQRTNFRFEILIRDDASTDCTPRVIRNYADRYPGIIIPVFETVNQYPSIKAHTVLRPMARGRYIAPCEGDDYWTDPLKLQKQVDYLDSQPRCVMCYHDFINIPSPTLTEPVQKHREPVGKMLTGPRLCTRMYRNLSSEWPSGLSRAPNGDQASLFFLEGYGRIERLDNVGPSVRRVHPGGIWSMVDEHRRAKMLVETWRVVAEVYAGSNRYHEAKQRHRRAEFSLAILRWRAARSLRERSFAALGVARCLMQPFALFAFLMRRLRRVVRHQIKSRASF